METIEHLRVAMRVFLRQVVRRARHVAGDMAQVTLVIDKVTQLIV